MHRAPALPCTPARHPWTPTAGPCAAAVSAETRRTCKTFATCAPTSHRRLHATVAVTPRRAIRCTPARVSQPPLLLPPLQMPCSTNASSDCFASTQVRSVMALGKRPGCAPTMFMTTHNHVVSSPPPPPGCARVSHLLRSLPVAGCWLGSQISEP